MFMVKMTAVFKNYNADTIQRAFSEWLNSAGVELSETDIWAAIREERNARLRKSDWVLIEDSPKSSDEKKLWKTYRRALRDLPQTYATPEAVIWPKEPETDG